MPAKLKHAGFKADARAGRILGEDHGQRLSLQQRVGGALLLPGLQFGRQIENFINFLRGQVQQFQQMSLHDYSSFLLGVLFVLS